MYKDLKGYKVLITGGTSGLGLAMAEQLLSEGASVMITACGEERLLAAEASLAAKGYDVCSCPMDVTDEASVAKAAALAEERFGCLDMVVCDAGIGGNAPALKGLAPGYRALDVPVEAVRQVVGTNLIGFFTTVKYFVPLMEKQGRGRLLYVATSTSTMTREGQVPYGPSKAGAEAMAIILSQELKDKGITVNIICPGGFTDTAMAPDGALDFMIKSGRPVLKPTVMNSLISWLASPDAEGVTGQKFVGKDFAPPAKIREV